MALSTDEIMCIEHACTRLSLDYSFYADSHQHEAWAALFTEDAEMTLLGQSHKGRAAILASVAGNNPAIASSHTLSNIRIDVVGPDEARGTVGIALYAAPKVNGVGQAKDITPAIVGNYHDIYWRTVDGWRFVRREFIPTIMRAPNEA